MFDERFFSNLTIVMWYQNGKEGLELYVQYSRPIKSGRKEKIMNFEFCPIVAIE